jgi:hypothetical protein
MTIDENSLDPEQYEMMYGKPLSYEDCDEMDRRECDLYHDSIEKTFTATLKE